MSGRSPAQSLVLFDIDGTLMRGAGLQHRDALIEGVRRVTGIACSMDGIDPSGCLDRDLIALMLLANGISRRRIARDLARIVHESQQAYLANCTADLASKLCRGVSETLAQLTERQIPLALVTGNLSQIGWRKIELAGLRSFFRFGAFAEQGRTRSRLAQLAAWQARREGLVTRHGRVTLIGDHSNDVQAAKANNFQSIAVATGVLSADELRPFQPDILVSHLEELDLSVL